MKRPLSSLPLLRSCAFSTAQAKQTLLTDTKNMLRELSRPAMCLAVDQIAVLRQGRQQALKETRQWLAGQEQARHRVTDRQDLNAVLPRQESIKALQVKHSGPGAGASPLQRRGAFGAALTWPGLTSP